MVHTEETLARLAAIPDLTVLTQRPAFPLHAIRHRRSRPTSTPRPPASKHSSQRLIVARASGQNYVVIGGGTNLIVSDDGFRGIVLRFIAPSASSPPATAWWRMAGLCSRTCGFHRRPRPEGLETLAGIPGSVGAAVYGNAGAYGHSISERVRTVRFYDGRDVRVFDNEDCEFHYRESVFKRHKDWIIFSS